MIGRAHFFGEARLPRASWIAMSSLEGRRSSRSWPRRWIALVLSPLALLFTSGATVVHPAYSVNGAATAVPAEVVADFFLVQVRIAGQGPFRFLLDTGSSVSLVSPALVAQLGLFRRTENTIDVGANATKRARLFSVDLPELALGAAKFEKLNAGVFDLADLSRQLGARVDGILGFPVFRDVMVTIDYPNRRLVIDPQGRLSELTADALDFYGDYGVPIAAVDVGGQSLMTLIDTGSDTALTLNSSAAATRFVRNSRRGSVRATVAGDQPQVVGRLAADLSIGSARVERPIVEVADGFPSLGNSVLKHFAVTFDSRHGRMALRRGDEQPIRFAAQRSVGLGFVRGEEDWRVAAIVPDTPAAQLAIREGDRCVRINGEPTLDWPLERYQGLLRSSEAVTFTFASEGGETSLRLPVVELVR